MSSFPSSVLLVPARGTSSWPCLVLLGETEAPVQHSNSADVVRGRGRITPVQKGVMSPTRVGDEDDSPEATVAAALGRVAPHTRMPLLFGGPGRTGVENRPLRAYIRVCVARGKSGCERVRRPASGVLRRSLNTFRVDDLPQAGLCPTPSGEPWHESPPRPFVFFDAVHRLRSCWPPG